MSEPIAVPRKLWAVVATGTMLPTGLPKYLQDSTGAIYPIVVYRHADKEKAERRLRSLETMFRTIRGFSEPAMKPSKPFLGVVEIELPAKKAGRKVSKEQVQKMQEGRKASQKEPAVAGKVPAAK